VPTRVGLIHHAWLWRWLRSVGYVCSAQLDAGPCLQHIAKRLQARAFRFITAFRLQQVIRVRISGHQPTLS
jgi:hypothetical protein